MTATITKNCKGPNDQAPQPGDTDTCSVITGGDPVPVAGSVQVTLQSPNYTPGTLVCTGVSGLTTATLVNGTCVFKNITSSPLPSVLQSSTTMIS